ncbi:hypothetical protein MNV49_005949 [Pseudohyphozyma bogoriensis]|nr:hypothetical protein MNV49_005949 [Pseudohyphozyma bogoriensis]
MRTSFVLLLSALTLTTATHGPDHHSHDNVARAHPVVDGNPKMVKVKRGGEVEEMIEKREAKPTFTPGPKEHGKRWIWGTTIINDGDPGASTIGLGGNQNNFPSVANAALLAGLASRLQSQQNAMESRLASIRSSQMAARASLASSRSAAAAKTTAPPA